MHSLSNFQICNTELLPIVTMLPSYIFLNLFFGEGNGTTPVLLPGKSHGQRSLVGCSPWDHKESDTTERLHFHFSLLCIGEGNVNPLQCSCLETPRDGGAWWAAVYGVPQSQTQLKWLSSKPLFSYKWLFNYIHLWLSHSLNFIDYFIP